MLAHHPLDITCPHSAFHTSIDRLARQHHCRNCGQTFCSKCSAKSAPLPHFGLAEAVRVCDACFTKVTQPAAAAAPKAKAAAPSPPPAPSAADAVLAPAPEKPKKIVQKTCVCGLPMCICPDPKEPTPAEERKAAAAADAAQAAKSANAANAAPANKPKVAAARPTFGFGGSSSSSGSSAKFVIDWQGDLAEQCRDAIKNGDAAAVQELVTKGEVPAQWVDRQGQTLLHLAAMFNRTDVCMMLLERGADPLARNAQKEGVLDVAPPALAAKIKAFAASK